MAYAIVMPLAGAVVAMVSSLSGIGRFRHASATASAVAGPCRRAWVARRRCEGGAPGSDRLARVYISAKVDYAVRALCTLADASTPLTSEALAHSQGLPSKFLESILNDMRRAGILTSQRGPDGGYRLARPAGEISVADVIRPLDGPLAEVRGLRPEATEYEGAAENLQAVWVAVRASLRSVLDQVTIASIVSGELPPSVVSLTSDPEAWKSR